MGVGIGLPSLVQETQFDGTSLFLRRAAGRVPAGTCLCMPDHGHPVREAHHSLPGHGDRAGAQPHSGGPGGGEVLTPLALLGGAIVFISVMVYNVLNLRLEKQRAAVPTQEPDLPSRKE